ncbi:hypothetical protein FVEN_g13189 [Fusarium venenatum]|nr:hypothetical protein FVEN_g13189 [Fusarium venenatum]
MPRFSRGNLSHVFPALQTFPLCRLLSDINRPLPSLAPACSAVDEGYTLCCVCNLVRTTSCGYVTIVAHALLATLAVNTPRIWRRSWPSCQLPSPDPVKYILNCSYNGNCMAKCVTPSRAGVSPE